MSCVDGGMEEPVLVDVVSRSVVDVGEFALVVLGVVESMEDVEEVEDEEVRSAVLLEEVEEVDEMEADVVLSAAELLIVTALTWCR